MINLVENAKNDWDKLLGKERRPVVFSSINPSEEEVVISVRSAFCFKEEFLGSSLIKFSSRFCTQGHMNNMEISVFSILNPVAEFVSLNVMYRPVPCVLAFNNVKFSVESKCHS